MKIIILGGGLAALSLAYYLQNCRNIEQIEIIEKESMLGGLCRSFTHYGINCDVGPHILFSKDKAALEFLIRLLGDNAREFKRNNYILHRDVQIQYPFENDLSRLPPEDCLYCLNTFLHNQYKQYPASNMLQFFLKTFGEGITNLYLRPYNEKIWRFDPSFMDTQMVDRIPRPPDETIIRSANGETIEGNLHQLYFTYPHSGGMGALITGLEKKLSAKVITHTNCEVNKVIRTESKYSVGTVSGGNFTADKLVSCMPADLFVKYYEGVPASIRNNAQGLMHNNIAIIVVTLSEDRAKDRLTFTIANKNVLFHRLTRLDYWGEHIPDTVTYMAEVTYRENDIIDLMPNDELREKVLVGLRELKLYQDGDSVIHSTVRRFPYAYVIYDLAHNCNISAIREYFAAEGIALHGRFGNYEYWNMDRIITESKLLAETLVKELTG